MILGLANPFVVLIVLSTLALTIRAARPSGDRRRTLVSELPLVLLPAAFGLSGAMANDLELTELPHRLFGVETLHPPDAVRLAILGVAALGVAGSVVVLAAGFVRRDTHAR